MPELKHFAAYVLEHKLPEYVAESLAETKASNMPLMELFAHLSDEELNQMGTETAVRFLSGLKNGTAMQDSDEMLHRWKENKLQGISRDQVHPADIVMLYSIRKLALARFLTDYTQDVDTIVGIVREMEVYHATVKRKAVELLFEIQKETEAVLAKKHRQLEEAQALAHIGSWEWDMEHHTLVWSREMFQIFEMEPQAMPLSEDLVVVLMKEWGIRQTGEFRALIATGKPFEKESLVINSEGKEKVLLNRGQGLKNSAGQITRVVGTTQDITDIRMAEVEKELSRQKDEFIGIASHELKTPLTVVKGYLQLLEEEIGKDNRYLSKSLQHVDKLHKLVLNLLDVTRIEAGKMAMEMVPVNLHSLLNDTIEHFSVAHVKHRIVREDQNTDLMISADPQRLEQVLSNLLENAIKYSPKADTIRIKASTVKGMAQVEIRDFGIGIPQDQLDKVFVRFFRAGGLGPTFPGLGIGLYISHEIVRRHKGIMWVESKEGKGSIFSFQLPILQKKPING